ncbi:MAG: CotH kinase family protein, partial [Phycisphaerales bacterium]
MPGRVRGMFPSLILTVFFAGALHGQCPLGDLSGDCRVDYHDLSALAERWLDPPGSAADLDGLNGVEHRDFALLAGEWGRHGVPLVINEFLASNSSGQKDPQGEYDDWIEIYNAGGEPIDTAGMYLTDDLDDPTKWRIPAGMSGVTTLARGGYLLIWADNDTADPGLHAAFELDAQREQIGLFDTDASTLIDSIKFADHGPDVSFGRFPDGNDSWQFFPFPSPGWANIGVFQGIVEDVEFSHEHGFYDEPFAVTLTTETEGAIIYYTVDGSDPYDMGGGPNGAPYSGPIVITKTTCLRAKAIKLAWMPSEVGTRTYIFLDDVISQPANPAGFPGSWGSTSADYEMDPDIVDNPLYRDGIKDDLKSIPTLSIAMDRDDLFDASIGIYANPTNRGVQWERPASAELIDPVGREDFQINCGIRIQGGAFRNWGLTKKKSFRLLFKGIYGATKLDSPFLGESAVGSFDTITLRGGANDGYAWSAAYLTEQYTRDEFGRSLQRATGHAGSHGIFVHLYLNGLYWGLYNPVERPDHSFSASYYGGDKDNWDAINSGSVTNGNMTAWSQMISKTQAAAGSIDAYQELQGNNPDGTPNPTYPNLLDVTNYVDYLIVNLWGGNWDWPWKNWWACRDRSENSSGFKFYCWDYENTIGNNRSRSPLNKNAL